LWGMFKKRGGLGVGAWAFAVDMQSFLKLY
jgi:hypothetical protein